MIPSIWEAMPSIISMLICLIALIALFATGTTATKLRKSCLGQVNSQNKTAREIGEKRGVPMKFDPDYKVTGYYSLIQRHALINTAQADAKDILSVATVLHEGGHAADHKRIGPAFHLLDHRPIFIGASVSTIVICNANHPGLCWTVLAVQGVYFVLNFLAERSASRQSDDGLVAENFSAVERAVARKYNLLALTNYAGQFTSTFALCLSLLSYAAVTDENLFGHSIDAALGLINTLLALA